MKLLSMFLGLCLLGFAHTGMAAGKIAVFDLQAAIGNTQQAQESEQKLNNNPEYAQLIAQLESLNADLKLLNKEREAKGMTWSAEQMAEHNKKEQYILADRQLAIKKIQAERAAVSEKIVQELQPKLQQVVQKVIEKEGIEILIQKQAVAYAAPAVDITDKVTAELDKMK